MSEKRSGIMKVLLFEIILATYQSNSSCILDLEFLMCHEKATSVAPENHVLLKEGKQNGLPFYIKGS